MATMQQYCLKWKYHHNNLLQMFSQLLLNENFTDVMLACEGKTLKAHKVVLSACSTYFEQLFLEFQEKNPIVILKDVSFADVQALVEFMYKGEINVTHDQLPSLLKTAENLHVKGLAEVSGKAEEVLHTNPSGSTPSSLPPSTTSSVPSFHTSTMIDQMSSSQQGGMDDSPPLKKRRGRPPLDSSAMQHSVFDPNCTPKVQPDDSGSMQMYGNQDGMNTSHGDMSEDSGGMSNAFLSLSGQGNGFDGITKMNDYLLTGTRQQFWDEASTKRVMEAVKNKEIEMKKAAEVLGVSYGTLYGRYREVYGCLKHPHKDSWNRSHQYPEVLDRLRRKEIDLTQASDLLNIKVSALSSYLTNLNTTTACHTMPQRHSDAPPGAMDLLLTASTTSSTTSRTSGPNLAPSPPLAPHPLLLDTNDNTQEDIPDEETEEDSPEEDHKPILHLPENEEGEKKSAASVLP